MGIKTDVAKDNLSCQSPFYKKRVIFVEDENDPVNADAVRGHLEAVGQSQHTPTFYEKYIKRLFDIVISFFSIIVFSPVFAITAIIIKIDDPGPAIFRQKRICRENGYFELKKFRSMKLDTPKNVPTHQLENPEQYFLRIGKFIRKTSIDELPQLVNVLSGSMSLVGPRPALWNQEFLIAERDKYGANDIRPGLTGFAQISGRDKLEISDKAQLDGEYAAKLKESSIAGFKMDVKIFFLTIKSVFKREGVVEGGTGTLKKLEAQETEEEETKLINV